MSNSLDIADIEFAVVGGGWWWWWWVVVVVGCGGVVSDFSVLLWAKAFGFGLGLS